MTASRAQRSWVSDLSDSSLRAVLFDIGGTLLEYVPEVSAAGRRLLEEGCRRAYDWLREQGKELPEYGEFARRHWRALWWGRLRRRMRGRELRAQRVVLEVLARMGVEVRPEEIYELTACYHRPFAETLRPMPGAREVLAELSRRGLKLATVSNTAWPGYLLEEDLARFGLTEHLEFSLYSSYFGRPKPAEGIFLQALKMLGVDSEEALFVGDSPKEDIWGAHRVGMRTVLVASDGPDNPRRVAYRRVAPDWVISQLAELLPIVERLVETEEEAGD